MHKENNHKKDDLLNKHRHADFHLKNIAKDLSVTFELKETDKKPLNEEEKLNELICRADWSDYIFALASGLTLGLLDAFFAKNFSLLDSQAWGTEKINKIVIYIAKKEGCKSKKLSACISYLEHNYPYPSDSLTNDFGGGRYHHLRDFTHHFGLSGLVFSIVSQFTGKVYGTDINGNFTYCVLDQKLIGKSFYEKICIGTIGWMYHVASDIASSSSSARAGKAGSGLPGPLLSCFKRLSASRLFGQKDSEFRQKLSSTIARLFNGTYVFDNGTSIKFDFRTELGVATSQVKRSFSAILNSLIVRAFYFIKRLTVEYDNCGSLKAVNWRKVLPFNNPTITRMMVVSSGMMTVIDVGRLILFWKHDKSTFHANSIASINIPGLGALVFSIGSEIKYAVKRKRTIKKILKDNEERNIPISSQTMLYINNQWIIADTRRKIIMEISKSLSQILLQVALFRIH